MKFLVFDTETTGLPENRNDTNPQWYKKHPHIVQISWILYDSNKSKMLNISDYIVKVPEDVNIPEESSNIHGITKEKNMKEGVSINKIISEFLIMLEHTDVIVGHNIDFDIKMVKAEFLRNGCVDPFLVQKHIPIYCTMEKGKRICKILATSKRTGRKYYKWPKLVELHKKLFGTEPRDLHNSLTDIYVTLRCFCAMEYNIDLLFNSKHFAQKTKHIFQ